MKTIRSVFYANLFGRVVHGFWGVSETFVTDEFGNSVALGKKGRDQVRYFLRGANAAPQTAF